MQGTGASSVLLLKKNTKILQGSLSFHDTHNYLNRHTFFTVCNIHQIDEILALKTVKRKKYHFFCT